MARGNGGGAASCARVVARVEGAGGRRADGCGDDCPWVPAKRREDWALPDPKHMEDEAYRTVRDDISARVRRLLTDLGLEA